MNTLPATTRRTTAGERPGAGRPRRAFTLLELMVAVSIIVLASVLLVPGFVRLLESSNYANAVNTVSSALGQARALAIRTGRYTGVAFLYDIAADRFTLQVLEVSSEGGTGFLTDIPQYQTAGAYAQAFRPAEGQAPIELPGGVGVYGLSFALTRTKDAQGQPLPRTAYQIDPGKAGTPTAHWYSGEILDEGVAPTATGGEMYPWIFPRNDPAFFVNPQELVSTNYQVWPSVGGMAMDPAARAAVRHANSFAVFFDPGGSMVSSTSDGGRSLSNAFLEFPGAPLDKSIPVADARLKGELDNGAVFDPEGPWSGQTIVRCDPNPEVVLKAASALAVVDLGRLSRETGIDRAYMVRPTYRNKVQAPHRTGFADSVYYSDASVRKVSQWIDRNAEVLTFDRFSGAVARRPGS